MPASDDDDRSRSSSPVLVEPIEDGVYHLPETDPTVDEVLASDATFALHPGALRLIAAANNLSHVTLGMFAHDVGNPDSGGDNAIVSQAYADKLLAMDGANVAAKAADGNSPAATPGGPPHYLAGLTRTALLVRLKEAVRTARARYSAAQAAQANEARFDGGNKAGDIASALAAAVAGGTAAQGGADEIALPAQPLSADKVLRMVDKARVQGVPISYQQVLVPGARLMTKVASDTSLKHRGTTAFRPRYTTLLSAPLKFLDSAAGTKPFATTCDTVNGQVQAYIHKLTAIAVALVGVMAPAAVTNGTRHRDRVHRPLHRPTHPRP